MSALHDIRERFVARGLPIPRELARALDALDNAPERHHGRLQRAVAVATPALAAVLDAGAHEGPLCPSYPRAPEDVQARVALGEPPSRILRGLTAREAHDALTAGVVDAREWILLPALGNCAVDCPVRSVPVARWLAACLGDPERRAALERERTVRGPGGEEVCGRLIDRVDEIAVADLPRGAATGVDAAFSSAGRRAYERWSREQSTRHERLAPPPRWFRPIRCARLLDTGAALQREGRELRHCVGAYAEAVRRQRSVIVSLFVCGQRSTVELSRDGRLRQHKGPGNRKPHPLCERALAVCLRRWGLS